MTEAQSHPPGPGDNDAWERLVDEGTRFAQDAIAGWAATTKDLVASEAGGVMAVAVVNAATWWFDWAKALQGLPYLGGAGRPGSTSRTPASR
jgi:hypothetical protein